MNDTDMSNVINQINNMLKNNEIPSDLKILLITSVIIQIISLITIQAINPAIILVIAQILIEMVLLT